MRISNGEFMKGLEKPNRDSETTQTWDVSTTPGTRRSVGWNGNIRAPKLGSSGRRCPEGDGANGQEVKTQLPAIRNLTRDRNMVAERERRRKKEKKRRGRGEERLKRGMHRPTERNTPASLHFLALQLPLGPPFCWPYREARRRGTLRNVDPGSRGQKGRRQRMNLRADRQGVHNNI